MALKRMAVVSKAHGWTSGDSVASLEHENKGGKDGKGKNKGRKSLLLVLNPGAGGGMYGPETRLNFNQAGTLLHRLEENGEDFLVLLREYVAEAALMAGEAAKEEGVIPSGAKAQPQVLAPRVFLVDVSKVEELADMEVRYVGDFDSLTAAVAWRDKAGLPKQDCPVIPPGHSAYPTGTDFANRFGKDDIAAFIAENMTAAS